VTIEAPAANIFVTADAAVPLVVTAKDDLAISDIGLAFIRSDQSDQGVAVTPLFTGPPEVAPRPGGPAASEGGDSRRVEHRWELGPLGLAAGVEITFHATVSDYLPQSGESQPRRLTVISREKLEEHIAERQSFILGEVSRALAMQQEARSQVAGLEIQLQDVGHLTRPDLDQLQGAELTQRQVDRSLTSPNEGVPAQIAGLLADLANNKIDSPDIQRRMEGLLAEIGRLEREHLPPIAQALTSAIKRTERRTACRLRRMTRSPPRSRTKQPRKDLRRRTRKARLSRLPLPILLPAMTQRRTWPIPARPPSRLGPNPISPRRKPLLPIQRRPTWPRRASTRTKSSPPWSGWWASFRGGRIMDGYIATSANCAATSLTWPRRRARSGVRR
jgi:hypothetical protein